MAVATYVSGFSPTVITEPAGSPFLNQKEHDSFKVLQANVKDAIADLRDDVEDAFVRSLCLGQIDPDMDLGTDLADPRGVVTVEGPIDASNATESIVLNLELTGAEPSGDDPDFGVVTLGTGNSAVTFTDRRPGNGDRHRPHGNRTLFVVDDRDGALNQSLAIEIGNTDIDNLVYKVVVIKLATDGAGAPTTTANNVVANATLLLHYAMTAGGTGLGVMAATTEPQQMEDGVGGYYHADIPGTTVTQTWSIGASTCTLAFDATDFAVDELVVAHVWLNGEHYAINIPTLSETPGLVADRVRRLSMNAPAAEAGNARTVDIQVLDLNGDAVAEATRIRCRTFTAATLVTGDANCTLTETGAGSALSGSGTDDLVILTDANGAAQITVTDASGVLNGSTFLHLGDDGLNVLKVYTGAVQEVAFVNP